MIKVINVKKGEGVAGWENVPVRVPARNTDNRHVGPAVRTVRKRELTQVLLPVLQKHYYLLTASNFLLYVLCFISYYQAININCKIPPTVPAPRHKSQLDFNHPLYTEKGECYR